MRLFIPSRVYFEPTSLDYPLGRSLYERFQELGIPIKATTAHNRVVDRLGETRKETFYQSKRTMVVGVRRSLKFQTSKPSADYALPLVTGCPGHCHYCYLNTTLGNKPFIRVYVNLDEILATAASLMEQRPEGVTVFDGSCTSDPVVVEPWTGALRTCIEFFAGRLDGRFRFVTKYDAIEGLLDVDHCGRTEVRFSINSAYVIKNFEKAVASLDRRLDAAAKIAQAGYPLGFIVGPIMIYDGWQQEYTQMMRDLAARLDGVSYSRPTFELVTHRFTPKAKSVISEVYPDTTLPMEESERTWRWGQFGYGKYVYRKSEYQQIRELFHDLIEDLLPQAKILYLV